MHTEDERADPDIATYLAPLREKWGDFRGNFYILCAIRNIMDDNCLRRRLKVMLIEQILDENGWESGQDPPTLYLRQRK